MSCERIHVNGPSANVLLGRTDLIPYNSPLFTTLSCFILLLGMCINNMTLEMFYFWNFSMLSHGTRLIIYMTMVTHSMLSDYFSVRIVHPEVHILQSISLTTEVVIF